MAEEAAHHFSSDRAIAPHVSQSSPSNAVASTGRISTVFCFLSRTLAQPGPRRSVVVPTAQVTCGKSSKLRSRLSGNSWSEPLPPKGAGSTSGKKSFETTVDKSTPLSHGQSEMTGETNPRQSVLKTNGNKLLRAAQKEAFSPFHGLARWGVLKAWQDH